MPAYSGFGFYSTRLGFGSDESTKASTVTADALTYQSVSKRIGQKALVRNVSFRVRPDETVLVAGLNGAGKTSLLKLALDFMRPDTGTIEIFGINSRRSKARRSLVFLPERFSTSGELTGSQILDLHCGLRGITYRPGQAASILEQLSFPLSVLDKPTRTYSKGMVQKLGLCTALLVRADLTILDEPLSGLDPVARRDVLACLQEIRGDGRALLYTSHSLMAMQTYCDSVFVIHDGTLQFSGTPAEMMSNFGTDSMEQAFIDCIAEPCGSHS